jgi:hypothetical protein
MTTETEAAARRFDFGSDPFLAVIQSEATDLSSIEDCARRWNRREVLRRCAPLDDGQLRVGGDSFVRRRSGSFAVGLDGEILRCAQNDELDATATATGTATAFEAGPSLRFGMTASFCKQRWWRSTMGRYLPQVCGDEDYEDFSGRVKFREA